MHFRRDQSIKISKHCQTFFSVTSTRIKGNLNASNSEKAVERGIVHLRDIVGVEVERESVDKPGKSLKSWRALVIRVGRWC